MSHEDPIHESVCDGTLTIGDIILDCHVLDDGSRVLSTKDLLSAFGVDADKRNQPRILSTFLDRLRFSSLSNNELTNRLQDPILFRVPRKGGRPRKGYPAELLPELCNSLLKHAARGHVEIDLMQQVDRARLLLNAFANVGLIALIDEATGYQEVRDKEELRRLLDHFLLDHKAAWAKRFPDDFYKEMFRLKGWEWRGMKENRPGVVGTYTNEIVYRRLAPGILEELQRLNPPDERGRRQAKHHQWLTPDIGHPALSQFLFGVVTLMRSSFTWEDFKRRLARSFPVYGDQKEFEFEENGE